MSTDSKTSMSGKLENRFQFGSISASVFVRSAQRESDGKVFRVRDVVIKRTYWNDVMQAWGDSCSFSVEELPRVRLVADQAYAFCLEARERERETEKKQNRTGS